MTTKVTAKDRRFVDAYLAHGQNGVAAITAIGFTGKRPDVAASKRLARPAVQELLEQRIAKITARDGAAVAKLIAKLDAIIDDPLTSKTVLLKAIELRGKYLAMWVERQEHTGLGGAPLTPPVINIGFANGGPGGDPRPEGP